MDFYSEYIGKMKRIVAIFQALSMLVLLSSCVKDELPNKECDIMSARANVAAADQVFFQLSDTLAPINADYASSMIQFQRVMPWADLKALAPKFTISEGAVLIPESGTVRDFSNDTTQVYFCVAEAELPMLAEMQRVNTPLEVQLAEAAKQGRFVRPYYVQFQRSRSALSSVLEYDFEHYYLEAKKQKFYEWSDPYEDGTQRSVPNWATANMGFSAARGTAAPDEYPTVPVKGEGVDGTDCVKLETCSTGDFGKLFGMPLAAGNLFLGTFDMSKALTNTLRATRFGENTTLESKPLQLTGYYKYRPGAQMTNERSEDIDGTDKPAIYCIVYKNHDAEGNPAVIYGDNVTDSPLIVARAEVKEWKYDTAEWVPFSLDFTWYESFDEKVAARKGYSYTIVASSSDGGATYTGAIGSRLYVDKFRLYLEE